jgi:pimeloyl-ACP methyl ester carboxylesterase
VVLDAGSASGGIETFGALEEDLIKPLARRSTVCTYDRAGTGGTAALPNKRRTIDDQAEELGALLTAADVPKPRVLVGSSWGGFVAVHTARNEPEGVGGIVLLDVRGWKREAHRDGSAGRRMGPPRERRARRLIPRRTHHGAR